MATDKRSADVNVTRTFLGDESQWPLVQIELNDVQPLWGGRNIRVKSNRHVVVQIVERGLQECRYEFEISTSGWQHLLDVLIDNDFVTILPAERSGIPDEARPTITLTNTSSQRHSVSKWAGVKDDRFAAVYGAMLHLVTYTTPLEPIYRGPYRFES